MAACLLHGTTELFGSTAQPALAHSLAAGLAFPAVAAANRVRLAAAACAAARAPPQQGQGQLLLPADIRLAASLFHCPGSGAALRPSHRRSSPAGWLDRRPLAAVVAATAANSNEHDELLLRWAAVRTNRVGRVTSGVSMQRWRDLLSKCAASAAAADTAALSAPAQLMRVLCLRALESGAGCATAARRHALAFYSDLDQQLPVLSEDARRRMLDPAWRDAWADMPLPDTPDEASAAAASERLLRGAAHGVWPVQRPAEEWTDDLHTVIHAAMVAAVPPGPPLHSEFRHSYKGSEPRPDCVEHVVRSLLDRLTWCSATGTFDASRLPASCLPAVRQFYIDETASSNSSSRSRSTAKDTSSWNEAARARRWFAICADLQADTSADIGAPHARQLQYLRSDGDRGDYELAPSADNVLAATVRLLGLGGGGSGCSSSVIASVLQVEVLAAVLSSGPGAGRAFGEMLVVSGGGDGVLAPLTIVLQPKLVLARPLILT